MSIARSTSELKLSAPPPSPIPTGRGTRSAANETLTDYLEKSLNVPDLALPEPYVPRYQHEDDPVEISYRLLESRDRESKDRLLKSVKELGVFKVVDHGISVEEMGFLVKEADRVFRVLEPKNVGFRKKYQKEIVWVLSGEEKMELAPEFVGAQTFPDFSEKMENVACKLDAISQQLLKVLVENTGKEHFGKAMTMQGKESILSLFRYVHKNEIESKPSLFINEENRKSSDHTLCLHFPITQSQFSVQTDQGSLSFDAGPDKIVVTVGKRLEERSGGEIVCEPHLQDGQTYFSIELRCLTSSLDISTKRDFYTIYLRDQILIGIIIAFLYNMYVFLWS